MLKNNKSIHISCMILNIKNICIKNIIKIKRKIKKLVMQEKQKTKKNI